MRKELVYNRIMSRVARVVKNALNESENWSDEVEPKFKPKKDIFAKGSAKEIADYLLSKSGEAKAMQRLNFYINRAGSNLTNKAALEGAKKILMNKKKKSIKESVSNAVSPLYLGTATEYQATDKVTKILGDYILHKGNIEDGGLGKTTKIDNFVWLSDCDEFGTSITVYYESWLTDFEPGSKGDYETAPTYDRATDADFSIEKIHIESDFYPDDYPAMENYSYDIVFNPKQYDYIWKCVLERFGPIDLESFDDDIDEWRQDIIDYNNDYDPD